MSQITLSTLPSCLTNGNNPANLLPPPSAWSSTVAQWIAEDCPSMDWGGFVVGEDEKEAILWCKKDSVLAGAPFVDEIFRQLSCKVDWSTAEGSYIDLAQLGAKKVEVARVRGKARNLLLGERVALNTLTRCSGVATKSRNLVVAARTLGFEGYVAGTRKTTPGFRLVEKYGMIIGGADAHRYDLSSMIMLKDNHIWSKGSIPQAISSLKTTLSFAQKIHIECTSLDEAYSALDHGADVIMLDNFSPADLKDAAQKLKAYRKEKGYSAIVEVSGGVTESNLKDWVVEGIDVISTSSIHQGVPVGDFSLKIIPQS
ncbi:nicotinate-nucleotide diphosphorylase [Atractiella rhizophila]|nr:nicotinate-nucleotide diphosphorylase [Atractiella rhizophila]